MTSWGSTEPQKEFKPLDENYIKMIFSDFFDNESAGIKHSDHDNFKGVKYEYITVTINDIKFSHGNEIDGLIEYHNRCIEFLKEIKVCINRVKDTYKDVSVQIHLGGGYDPIGGTTHPTEYEVIIINKK
jgi:hypothetical protein